MTPPPNYDMLFNLTSSHVHLTEVSRIKRLVAEAVEVAITLCNASRDRFGTSKIFDIFDQIFPTAFVLNTGYWVYYSSEQGHCLCVCNRFGIYCRHRRNLKHWVDMTCVTEMDEFNSLRLTTPTSYAHLANYYAEVVNTYPCYNILVRFMLQVGQHIGPSTCDVKHICFRARYLITPELYFSQLPCVVFQPNPQMMLMYGQLLPNILHRDNMRATMTMLNMPRYTYVLNESQIALPLPSLHHGILAIQLCCEYYPSEREYCMIRATKDLTTADKETQTEHDDGSSPTAPLLTSSGNETGASSTNTLYTTYTPMFHHNPMSLAGFKPEPREFQQFDYIGGSMSLKPDSVLSFHYPHVISDRTERIFDRPINRAQKSAEKPTGNSSARNAVRCPSAVSGIRQCVRKRKGSIEASAKCEGNIKTEAQNQEDVEEKPSSSSNASSSSAGDAASGSAKDSKKEIDNDFEIINELIADDLQNRRKKEEPAYRILNPTCPVFVD